MKDFLFENEYGKPFIDQNNKVTIKPSEGTPEFLTPKEAFDFCVEIISAMQIKRFGRLL